MSYTDTIATIQLSINNFQTSDPSGYASATSANNSLSSQIAAGVQNNVAAMGDALRSTATVSMEMLTAGQPCQALQNLLGFVQAMESGSMLQPLVLQVQGSTTAAQILSYIQTIANDLTTALSAASTLLASFDNAVAAVGCAIGLLRNPCTVLNGINLLGSTVDQFDSSVAYARDAVNSIADIQGNMPKMTSANVSAVAVHVGNSLGLAGNISAFNSSISAWVS